MLTKLGSDLLYFVLDSIKNYVNGQILHLEFLGVVIDRFEYADDVELSEAKKEIIYELKEGDYIRPDFLDNLNNYFAEVVGAEASETVLYQIIKDSYLEIQEKKVVSAYPVIVTKDSKEIPALAKEKLEAIKKEIGQIDYPGNNKCVRLK